MKPSEHGRADRAEWDESLQRLGGDLLQSWRWGEFKQCHGWKVERLHAKGPDGEGMAQVLFRQRGRFTIAYAPRGPVLAERETDSSELLELIDETCARHRAIVLVIEPKHPLPAVWRDEGNGFTSGPEPFQASRTVKVQLASDEDLLAQMRKDTRYNISRAQRDGVVIDYAPIESSTIQTFYHLLRETSERRGFRIHPRSYYEDFLRTFDDQAILLFSRVGDAVTAGLIAARSGDEARSMYAGSASSHRRRGDTALLRFEAMRWARGHGCSRYDLGGIGPKTSSPVATRNDDSNGSHSTNLDGVKHFKVGFGGEIVTYPPTVERRYRQSLAWIVRRFHPRFRTASPK